MFGRTLCPALPSHQWNGVYIHGHSTFLSSWFSLPEINFFATPTSHTLSMYLTQFSHRRLGELTPRWIRTDGTTSICSLLLQPQSCCSCPNTYASLAAKYLLPSLWETQPWCSKILHFCPSLLPLSSSNFQGKGIAQFETCFQAWNCSHEHFPYCSPSM